jgi:hypothetical protein
MFALDPFISSQSAILLLMSFVILWLRLGRIHPPPSPTHCLCVPYLWKGKRRRHLSSLPRIELLLLRTIQPVKDIIAYRVYDTRTTPLSVTREDIIGNESDSLPVLYNAHIRHTSSAVS